MAFNPNLLPLVKAIANDRGDILNLSRSKTLTLRYVEICHSIRYKNQVHVEFISSHPIELTTEYVDKITTYTSKYDLTVYDVHSNYKDRVYVYCYPNLKKSPKPVRKQPAKTVKKDSLENNPAVEKTTFNGNILYTPVIFTPETIQEPPTQQPEKVLEINSVIESAMDTPELMGQALSTMDAPELTSQAMAPIDYNSVKFLTRSLTNNENFSKLRRYLAFFVPEKNRNLFIETESYLALKIQLVNEGLPNDDELMRNAYNEFLEDRGFTKHQIEADLDKLRYHLGNSHMIRSNQVKQNFNNYYYGMPTSSARFKADHAITHSTSTGRCAPTECVLV